MTILRSRDRKSETGRRDLIGSPILLIEDQRSIADMMSALLRQRWGCTVYVAHSMEETAALVAERNDFLVALCDLYLPDAPHGEVLDVIIRAGIPAVAMTAAFGEELRESILKKGVVDYVLKESINSYNYVSDLIGRLSKNRGIKVLVVDDSLSMRAMLKHALTQYGLTVLVAANGIEGLAALKEHPDLRVMLVDYHMPEMDGFELTVEARKLFGKERLAIIGISVVEQPALSARLLKNGANDFISKPFTFEEVVCRVNQNLEMLELIEISQNAANRDFLTGLHNRRYFFEAGGAQVEAASRNGEPVAAALIDVDNFKLINDRYGHECGDEILRELARRMGQQFRGHLLARIGGEEFAVLFEKADAEAARELLEGLRRAVEHRRFRCGDGDVPVTLSAGFCCDNAATIDSLLRCADARLYEAKQAGRNRVVSG